MSNTYTEAKNGPNTIHKGGRGRAEKAFSGSRGGKTENGYQRLAHFPKGVRLRESRKKATQLHGIPIAATSKSTGPKGGHRQKEKKKLKRERLATRKTTSLQQQCLAAVGLVRKLCPFPLLT